MFVVSLCEVIFVQGSAVPCKLNVFYFVIILNIASPPGYPPVKVKVYSYKASCPCQPFISNK